MNAEQIAAVQRSFEAVKPIAPQAAALFYGRLFEIAPETEPLFKADMAEQGRKLMTTLGMVVTSLDRLETVLPAVRQLAVKHVQWGVRPDHYEPVGNALLWTLEQGLGPAFTPEVRQSWVAAYGALSGVMVEAAYPKPAA